MKFYFTTPVWGTNHIDLFVNIGLPSLLAPGNLPGLREIGDCRYFIHTRPQDEARLTGSAAFQRLSQLMPVEIRHIRGPIANAYLTMSECHAEVLRLADEDGVPAVFPSPDHVWSDGSMVRMEEIALTGKTVIHMVGPRLDRDSFVPAVEQWRSADGILSIPARSLVGLAMQHLHRITHLHFWKPEDGEVGNQFYPSNMFWRVEGDGLVAHGFHLHPLMVRPEVKSDRSFVTIDDDMVQYVCPDLSRHYVVPDSDEILHFEISQRGHRIPEYAGKGDIERVLSWMNSQASALHLHLFQTGIRVHATDPADNAARKKFAAVFKQARKTAQAISRIYQMPPWALLIRHPAVFRERLSNPRVAKLEKLRDIHVRYIAMYRVLRLLGIVGFDRDFYVARGERRQIAGDLNGALADFTIVTQRCPDDAMAWSRAFMVRMAMGDFVGALADANTALSLRPEDSNLVVQHAEAAQCLEMWETALADYAAVARARPDRADLPARLAGVYAAWGDSLARNGRPTEALDCYATALEKYPDDVGVLSRRVNVKMGLGDYVGALADVDEACALAPDDPNLPAQRAWVAAAFGTRMPVA